MLKATRTLLILALALSAHRGLADLPEQTLSTVEITADQWASPRQRAERLARVGEQLMLPQSLDYAIEVFAEALKLDPQNARAGFYVHAFGPIFTLKGYFSRVQPVIEATNEAAFIEDYYRSLNRQWPFFRGEAKDIRTDRDVRKLLRQLGESWGAARAYFAEVATPLDVHSVWIESEYRRTREEPAMIWEWKNDRWITRPTGQMNTYVESESGLDQAARLCKADRPRDGVYHLAACPYLTVRTYAVDFADIEALRSYAAGHQLLGLLNTAYNTDGVMKLWGRGVTAERAGNQLADVEIAMTLIKAGAGPLEADQRLGEVRKLGTDIFGAVKWLKRTQNELCAPRPGFIFGNGICLTSKDFDESDLKKALAVTEATLAETPIDVSNGHGVRTQARMHRIYDYPATNLRDVAPHQFDLRGRANALPDPTLNGIFPFGDAPKFYRLGGR